ncbi:carbohydrate ABC transporter permease [Paenibacillus piri]|uniref:carbohydrate ABC transporter permease n=1 Tax=Paenibacillus piri TaxID=2547395 RepID=UPI001C703876|nr:carbohydrate ABC transporter permease [Paenibacillus piri]
MKNKLQPFDAINNVLLLLLSFVCVYPFINIAAVSVSDGVQVMSGKVYLLPQGLNLETFKYIFSTPRMGITQGMFNSLFYTVVGTVFAVCLTFATAYALSKKRVKGRYAIMMLFLIAWIFDAGLIPNYLINQKLGLVDSRWIMILPGAISTFLLIVTRSFLDTLPYELEESAFIDGANDLQIMGKIYFPLSTPVLATISVFYAVNIWNSFLTPMIYLRDKALHPIQLILYNLVIRPDPGSTTMENVISDGYTLLPKNIEAAVIVLAIFPILLVYPFAQRYFTQGMLLGSLKG